MGEMLSSWDLYLVKYGGVEWRGLNLGSMTSVGPTIFPPIVKGQNFS